MQEPAPPSEPPNNAGLEIPADFLCAHCGYPAGGSGSETCPECGQPITEEDLLAREHRAVVIGDWRTVGSPKSHATWLAVGAGYSLLFTIVSRSAGAGIFAGVVLFFLLTVSVLWAEVGLGGRPSERVRYCRAINARTLWRLHVPWLVFPLFVVVALFVGLIDAWAGAGNDSAYGVVLVSGLFIWCGSSLAAACLWWTARVDALGKGGYLSLDFRDGCALIGGALVALTAAGLGFVAGSVTAMSVADLLSKWL